MIYRYQVVVDVDINTQGTKQGANDTENYLRQVERQAIESSKRIAKEDLEYNKIRRQQAKETADYISQLSNKGYADKVEDYKRQKQDFANLEKEKQRIAKENADWQSNYEKESNERKLRANADYHQERFRQQQKAGQAQADFQRRLNQTMAGLDEPDVINAQTARNRAQSASVLDFSRSSISGALGSSSGIVSGQQATDVKRSADEANEVLNRLRKNFRDSSGEAGRWSQAFKGAFIGAVAGLTFATAIGGITALIGGMKDLTIAGIQAGARLETTTNALAVFTGSTASARAELKEIDEVARNTAGLRLESAEQGFQKLRALGFEANLAKGFIKELGEEKILSGASDEALDKIIFNFAQIASGGQKVSQELREILTQMPSLNSAFFNAFGSLDPKKIQAFFDKDTNDAFNRLNRAMAEAGAATGGLEDAWAKLLDEFIIVGREFAEPILDPLTRSIKEMTVGLDDSKDAWGKWGQYVGDIILGLEVSRREGQKRNDIYNIQQEKLAAMSFTENALFRTKFGKDSDIPVSETELEAYRKRDGNNALRGGFFGGLNEKGRLERERLQRINDAAKNSPALTQLGKSVYGLTDAEKEQQAKDLKLEQDRAKQADKDRQHQLARIDDYYSSIANIRENAFDLEVAQNETNIVKVFQIQQQNYSNNIKEVNEFYDRKIALNEGAEEEIYKLEIERNNKLRDLYTKQEIDRIKFEREQVEKRRINLIEANDLETRGMEQVFDRRNVELERNIRLGTVKTVEGYNELIDITQQRENLLSQQIRDEFALRIQDKSLNAQEIVNLEKKRDLDLAELQDQSLQKTREIEQAKEDAVIKNLTYQREATRETYQFMSGMASQFQKDFFDTSIFSSSTFKNFQEFVLKRSQRSGLTSQIASSDASALVARRIKEDADKALPDGTDLTTRLAILEKYNSLIDVAENRSSKLRNELNDIERGLPDKYEKFEKLADEIGKTAGAVDVLNEALLAHRQRLDSNDAEREIEYWQEVGKSTTDADKKLEASARLQQAQNAKTRLDYDQNIEKAELYRNSLAGINEEIGLLRSGDVKKLGALQDTFNKDKGRETKGLLEQLAFLEMESKDGGTNEMLRQQVELLQYIIDLRNREYEAVGRIAKAQEDAKDKLIFSKNRSDADLAEFLTSGKGITEIVSDARINAITAAYNGLDSVIGKLTAKFGLFGDVIKDVLSNLIKLALNNVFMKMFFPSGGAGSVSGGGGGLLGQVLGLGGGAVTSGASGGGGGLGSIGLGGIGIHSGGLGGGSNPYGGLLGAGSATSGAGTGAGGGGIGALSGLLSNPLMAGLLGGAIGARFGGSSTMGRIVGGAGLGGLAGLASFGLIGFAPAALLAAPLLIGAFFLGRNAARRRDEKTRNQAMLDAFKQIDDLIDKVKMDKIDGDSALASFDQIRTSYLEMANGLKDGKTRKIAIADVHRLDAKLVVLKQEIANQQSRKDRLAMSVPTFGEGGHLSAFAGKNFVNNPLGYQNRPESFGYFPSSNTVARFNERGSEYIFDAQTTRNIGSHNLDMMRQTKGESFNAMRRQMVMPSRVEGGGFNIPVSNQTQSDGNVGQPKIEITVVNQIGMEEFVKIASAIVKMGNGSEEQLSAIIANFKKQGSNNHLKELQVLMDKVKNG